MKKHYHTNLKSNNMKIEIYNKILKDIMYIYAINNKYTIKHIT